MVAGQGSCTGRERQPTPGGSLEELHWSQRERTGPQHPTESSGTVTPPQSLFLTHLQNRNQILACSSGRVAPRIRVITNLKVARLSNGRHYYEVAAPSYAFYLLAPLLNEKDTLPLAFSRRESFLRVLSVGVGSTHAFLRVIKHLFTRLSVPTRDFEHGNLWGLRPSGGCFLLDNSFKDAEPYFIYCLL